MQLDVNSSAIDAGDPPIGKAQIIEVSGKVVDEFLITSKREIISPKKLSSGIYLLRFSNGSLVQISRK